MVVQCLCCLTTLDFLAKLPSLGASQWLANLGCGSTLDTEILGDEGLKMAAEIYRATPASTQAGGARCCAAVPRWQGRLNF